MTPSSRYFMHDQVHHRVARLMAARRPRTLAFPVWPLIVAVAALTVINVVAVTPPL